MNKRVLALVCAAVTISSVSCVSQNTTQQVTLSSEQAAEAVAEESAAASESAEARSEESSGAETGGQLNLYTWEGMFPQEILDGFESDSGVKIDYINFDTDETMLAKLQTANGGDYDLVIADDYIIETAVAENLVQKLDASKLSNYGNINPMYQGQFYDPANEYTVPYGAGVLTLLYDPSVVSLDIKGYGDLWDASLKDSVGLIANYRVINGVALKVLGESFNTNDLDTIQKAGDKLVELAPNIRVIKDDALQNDLLSGEISAGIFYTSQATSAKLENPDLRVVFPEEGIGFGIMAGFIPSNAPNAEAAYAFLDYILDPERGARCFEYLGYYSTFSASDPLISPEYKEFLTLPDGFNSDMEMIENISAEANEKHEQIWTAFKTASGME
ncbi:MAG: spermidine/putrescine ABC transporter substrate-binding protein [Clostridiales bacterium]|jgi:spermidine/putrescine-binding protein|nr:spermidine/putrescine ABC transporter substrate-binding protein [Clostridiales bacterium]